jgi:peptidoglycan/LPS O-acetylase OafA/YrhL
MFHTLSVIASSPLAALWNGPFTVSIFFVPSGFVVAKAALRRNDPLWIDIAMRYLRLGVGATVSLIVAWSFPSAFPTAASGRRS